MKVLIIENESYLAASIAAKLADKSYACEIATLPLAPASEDKYDVVLLSTGAVGVDFGKIIKKYQNAIIILMINYISSDIITMMKAGADDYILKPIIIEELLRKIKLFDNYKKMNLLNRSFERFIKSLTKGYEVESAKDKKFKFPLELVSKSYDVAGVFVFSLAKERGLAYLYIEAGDENISNLISTAGGATLVFISKFDTLEEETQKNILALANKKNLVVSCASTLSLAGFSSIELKANYSEFPARDIITIDEYVKFVIATYQDSYPDTELSRKLGISRKSLWEKRKRYEIAKKK